MTAFGWLALVPLILRVVFPWLSSRWRHVQKTTIAGARTLEARRLAPIALWPQTDWRTIAVKMGLLALRLKVIDEEVMLIGLALQKGLITPQEAIARTEEIAPGCLDVVATSMGVLA